MNRQTYFEEMYRADADPWRYATSAYEAEKYRRTVAMLPRDRYGAVLEVGCSIGILSRMLFERCDRFLGIDLSATALESARARSLPGMAFERMEVPAEWPAGHFDLIVLSEVLYYLTEDEIGIVAQHCMESLSSGGHCIAVNWLGSTGAALDGATAADMFARSLAEHRRQTTRRRERHTHYLIDLFV